MVVHKAGRHGAACNKSCLHAQNFLLAVKSFQDRQIATAVKRDTIRSCFLSAMAQGGAPAVAAAGSADEQLLAFIKTVPWEGK